MTKEQLSEARKRLELAQQRLIDAVQIMLDSELDEISMRAHVAMTKHVQSVCSMASEAKSRAEDASIAKDLRIPTTIQRSQDKHAAYGPKNKKKGTQ